MILIMMIPPYFSQRGGKFWSLSQSLRLDVVHLHSDDDDDEDNDNDHEYDDEDGGLHTMRDILHLDFVF